MRRLSLAAAVVLGLAACGGGAAAHGLKITFGTSGGTMVPSSTTIAPDGWVTRHGGVPTGPHPLPSPEAAHLFDLVRKDFPSLESQSCPGTFPDESARFIIALGKTVTVRGACEPAFTNLWNTLSRTY